MKSQSAVEFMLFMGIAVVILMGYFGMSNNYLNRVNAEREMVSGEDIVRLIKSEIDAVSRSEDSINRIVDLPPRINNNEYRGQINGREVVVNIGGNEYVGLLSVYISDPYEFGGNSRMVIKKVNGEVLIS